MQNKFLSKSVPRGTRTIWRYLGALFILFTFAIGNVWAADPQDTYYKFTSTASSGANVAPVSGDGGNITLGSNSAAKITAQNAWYMGVTYTHAININSSDAKSFSLNISASTENPAHVFVLVTSDNRTIKLKNGSTDVDQCGVRGTAGISSYTAAASLVELVTTKTGSHVIYASGSAFVYAVRVVYEKNSLWNEIKGLSDVTLDKDKTLADDLSTLYFFRMQDFCFNTDGVIPSGGAVSNGLRFSINFKAQQDGEVTVNYANPGGSGRNLTVTEFTRPTTAGTSIVNQSVAKNTTTYADKKFDVEAGKEYVVGFSGAGATIKSINFKAATSWTITYDANGGTGTMENSTNNVADCGFTYEGKDFAGWKDGEGNDYEVGTTVDGNVTLYAQWVDHVAKYTLIYKVDGVEKGRETVNVVGGTPEGITAPTKDCYTFAGWSPALTDVTGTDGAEVETNATWTPNYALGAYSFNALTVGTSPAKTINGNEVVYDDPFRVDNFYFDGGIKIQGEVGTDAEGLALDNFKGWKLKTTGKNIKFLVENNCQVKVAVGSANTLKVIYTALDGTEKNVNLAQQTETPYLVKGGTIVTLQTTTGSTITLKRIEISAFYDATLTDTKSNGSASKPSVAEVTLPTPTAVSGWMFTGWVANADVKAGEDTKTAGTVLAAGTYTLLDNTTFTAQWVQLYAVTYDNNGGDGIMTDSNSPYAEGAEVTLLDNTFTAPTNKIFGSWVATYNDGTEKTLTITNGKFTMPAYDVTVTAQWVDDNKVAKIGETYYTSLEGAEGAFANVADGQTIELLKNCDVTSQLEIAAGVTATIDLNGYKIEYTGSTTLPSGVILVHNGASLTINDSSEPSTGKVFAGTKAYAAVALTKLGDDASTPATLVVNGGALTGYYYGITGNGSRNNTVITINGGTITGTVGTAIYNPQVGTLTVNNGTLTGLDAAIEMRAGTLVINDGTFTATATEFSCNPNGSGSTTTGAAIAIAQHTTKKDIEVTINGGTFNGVKALNESNPQVNDPAPQVTMAVTAGTFTGEVTTVDVNNFISGGTFDHEVAANQCAEGYIPSAEIASGKYGVIATAKSVDFTDSDVQALGVGTAMSTYNYTLASTSGVSFDSNNAYDTGLKMKNSTTNTLSFIVEPGKLVTIITGNIAGMTYSVNGGAADDLNGGTDKDHLGYTYLYNDAVQNIVLAETSETYNIIREINIHSPYEVSFDSHGADPISAQFATPSVILPTPANGTGVFKGWYDAETEGNKIGNAGDSYTPTATVTLHAQWEAVSTDNTLSALEVDGVALADFDPDKHIYNIVCEYGHTPQITLATATAAAQGATVTYVNTPADGDGYKYIQANVIPASGTPIGYNQVRYTNLPKQGATIFKAELTSATEATYSGLYADEANSEIKLTKDNQNNNEYKFSGTGNYIKIALQNGTFAAGDVLKMTYSTNPQNGYLALYPSLDSPDSIVSAASPATTLVLPAGAEAYNTLYIRRTNKNNYNAWVTAVEVQRLMDPFIAELKVGDALATIDEEANPKTITIEVPASTDITALTPSIKAYANGGATVTPAVPQDFSAGAVEYTVTSYYDETTTYQVTVTKAEASHDATLSALSVAGYSLSPAFDPAVLTYNVELPKGSVIGDLPAVSYTLNHVGATAVKTEATVLPGATTIVVTAEDGLEANKKTYTINFTVSTKDKVVIFDGSTMDALATSPDASGLSWELVGLSVSSKTIGSYTHAIATGGSTSNTKHIKISVPAKYEAQFEIGQATNSNTKERNALVKTTANQGDSETLFTVSSSNSSEAAVATSGALAGGKDYYLHSDNSINFVKIVAYLDRVSEAPAISAQPAALAVCDAATNTNALSVAASVEPGTLSYQWYKVVEEGDDVAVGTNSNEFVPTALGDYYVVVTNTEGSYKPSSTKSEIATVSLKAQTEITGFENAAAPLNTEKTLSVTAAGTGTLTYKWQTCTEAGVVTDENVLSSAAAYDVVITEEPQYYLVTVEGECGSATQVLFAKKWADLELVDVNDSITWNFAASNTGITGDVTVPSTMVLANAGQGAMPNTDNFRSDMLKAIVGTTQTKVRKGTDDGCYQGTGIMFHTTVPGIVTVTYRGTGNNENVTLTVGSKTFDTYHGGFTTCDKVFVPAGDVVISSVGTMRIQKIVFNAKPDYTRDVTEGRYGTICLPKAGVMTGATLYEVAYYGATSKKIFFDEVLNGEMQAGVPYIFLPEEGADQLGVFYTNDAVETAQSVNGLVGFIGANKEDAQEVPVGSYILSNNQYRKVVYAESAYIKSNRSYINLSAINPSEPTLAPGRRRISMSVQGEQTATDIDNIFGNDTKAEKVLINGQLFILRGGKMFDAAGQLVK